MWAQRRHGVRCPLERRSRSGHGVGFTIRQRDVIPMFNPNSTMLRKPSARLGSFFVVGRKGVSQEVASPWIAEFELGRQGRFLFSLNRDLFLAEK